MKRLLIVLVSLATTYVVAEAPPCLVDFQEKVSEDSLKKILEMRPKAVKHCLICGTNSCKLKTWSEVNEANDKVCKRLFCKPIKTNRNVYASSENLNLGRTSVSFTFGINTKGKIENIKLTALEGEMGRKMAHTYLKDNLKTLRYQPLIIDGKSYSLNALNGMTSWNIYQK